MLYQFSNIFSKYFGAGTPLKATSVPILPGCQPCVLNFADSALAWRVYSAALSCQNTQKEGAPEELVSL